MSAKIDIYGLSRGQWEALIDEWIFSERDRAILKRRLLDGICVEPLAEEFDMSVRQINYILSREQKKLFSKI
jgi:hypothetical protein